MYWTYLGLRPVRRECVHGVARQTGIVRQALGLRAPPGGCDEALTDTRGPWPRVPAGARIEG